MAIIATILMTSCTSNEMAKQYGGTTKIDLPTNQKLVNATWKDNELWYLTRTMKQDETAETYKFKEKSNYNIMEGTVLIVEHK